MKLSPKYKAFLKYPAVVEFLEGTTFAGKTTIGVLKFMNHVCQSEKKLHIISGLDLGTVEKNIINKELGIIHVFGSCVVYNSSGAGKYSKPHIAYYTPMGEKIIYVLGYDTKVRWKKVLGGQYGCVYIDEINVADMDYVREISIRCDYLLATLNPDDPNLPIYHEYINHSRPLVEWEHETPKELLEQLKEQPKDGWIHWYFSFMHNAGLDKKKREQIINSVQKDTKLYKNKILGLRGRSTGLIFNLCKEHIISKDKAKEYQFQLFSCGVDTSYSQKSQDTFAFVFSGFTKCGRKVTLAVQTYNNKDLAEPISPSDIPVLLIKFLEKCRDEWGFAKDIFIDSADQATITECNKHKRTKGAIYNFVPSYKQLKIIDRLNLQIGWMAGGNYLILDGCKELIDEMNVYSWKTDGNEPEDRNDHTINADQYSWIPYKHMIGRGD